MRSSPRPTTACRTGAEAARATGPRFVSPRIAQDGRGPGSDWERGGNVVEREGALVGGAVPPAAPSPAERPISRKRARKPDAADHALSVGVLDAGDRSRSRAAKQIRLAPGRRRHARRRAVRLSQRMPGAGADHDARGRGGPARLADPARAGRQQPRGQPGAGGKRGAIRSRRRARDRTRPRI